MVPILQKRKLRFREVKKLVQRYTARKLCNWDLSKSSSKANVDINDSWKSLVMMYLSRWS